MTGTAVLKKNIRDCERLLRRPTLPADVRQEKERKLAALRHAAAQQLTANKQRDLQQRYKMVKFVEAKKAQRRLQQALRAGDEEAIKEARKDCLYIQFFPCSEKYVSLWPTEEMQDESQLARRKELRESIFAEHERDEIKLPGMKATVVKHAGVSDDSEEEEVDDDEDDEEEDDESTQSEDDEDDSELDDDDSLDQSSLDEDDDEDDDDSISENEDEDDEDDDSDDGSDISDDEDDSEDEDDSDDYGSDEFFNSDEDDSEDEEEEEEDDKKKKKTKKSKQESESDSDSDDSDSPSSKKPRRN